MTIQKIGSATMVGILPKGGDVIDLLQHIHLNRFGAYKTANRGFYKEVLKDVQRAGLVKVRFGKPSLTTTGQRAMKILSLLFDMRTDEEIQELNIIEIELGTGLPTSAIEDTLKVLIPVNFVEIVDIPFTGAAREWLRQKLEDRNSI